MGFDQASHLDGFFDGGSTFDELVAAQPDAERKFGTDRLSHCVDDLKQNSGTVLQRSTVRIVALIGSSREKPTNNRGMAALQFDSVKATLATMAGNQCVATDDFSDLASVDGLRHFAEQRVWHRRRRPHRQTRIHRRRLTTVVVDLCEDRDTMAMYCVGDGPVSGDHSPVKPVDQFFVRPIGGVR